MFNVLTYCSRTAAQSIRMNLLPNIATIVITTITFIIFISFILLLLNLSLFKQNWVNQLHIIVFLKDDTPQKNIDTLMQSLARMEEVHSLQFVSKEKALTLLRTTLQGQDGILEGLKTNPLPASIEINLKESHLTAEGFESFVVKLRDTACIADIEYGQKWLERFSAFFGILNIAGFSLGALLFIFTLFIISNTIKLAVYNRRDEIEIMRLVGATSFFIRLPFCIEAMFQGLVGSLLALVFTHSAIQHGLKKLFSSLQFSFDNGSLVLIDLPIALYVLLLGAILGLAGSLASLSSIHEMQA